MGNGGGHHPGSDGTRVGVEIEEHPAIVALVGHGQSGHERARKSSQLRDKNNHWKIVGRMTIENWREKVFTIFFLGRHT